MKFGCLRDASVTSTTNQQAGKQCHVVTVQILRGLSQVDLNEVSNFT